MNLPIFTKRKIRGVEILDQYLVKGIEGVGVETEGKLNVEYSDGEWQGYVPFQGLLTLEFIKEAAQLVGLPIEVKMQAVTTGLGELTTRPSKCVHGHRQISENVIHWPNGSEDCRVCYMKWKTKKLTKSRKAT